jgi:hypothetical protein
MNTSGQRTCIYVLALAVAFLSFRGTSQAEDIEITHCYSGTFVPFNKTEGTSPLLSWAQNGIIMSAHPKKLLQNAVVHCEGIQIAPSYGR